VWSEDEPSVESQGFRLQCLIATPTLAHESPRGQLHVDYGLVFQRHVAPVVRHSTAHMQPARRDARDKPAIVGAQAIAVEPQMERTTGRDARERRHRSPEKQATPLVQLRTPGRDDTPARLAYEQFQLAVRDVQNQLRDQAAIRLRAHRVTARGRRAQHERQRPVPRRKGKDPERPAIEGYRQAHALPAPAPERECHVFPRPEDSTVVRASQPYRGQVSARP
jgi:hypothetical protein